VAKVIFSAELQRYANGTRELEVAADSYQQLVSELCQRFPAITAAVLDKYALAIDGVVNQMPLLARFKRDSELIFIARIAGG
jgi:hypothetical protein